MNAFIEGPWIEQFLSYLSELKKSQDIEAEEHRNATEQRSVEDLTNLKNKFGFP